MSNIHRVGHRPERVVTRTSSRKRYGLLLAALVLAATVAGFTATGRNISPAAPGHNFTLKLPGAGGGFEEALY
jgi:hypothetical protein